MERKAFAFRRVWDEEACPVSGWAGWGRRVNAVKDNREDSLRPSQTAEDWLFEATRDAARIEVGLR